MKNHHLVASLTAILKSFPSFLLTHGGDCRSLLLRLKKTEKKVSHTALAQEKLEGKSDCFAEKRKKVETQAEKRIEKYK